MGDDEGFGADFALVGFAAGDVAGREGVFAGGVAGFFAGGVAGFFAGGVAGFVTGGSAVEGFAGDGVEGGRGVGFGVCGVVRVAGVLGRDGRGVGSVVPARLVV